MNRIRYRFLLVIGGLVLLLAALYFVFIFPAKEQPETRIIDKKKEARKATAAHKIAEKACRLASSKVVVLAPKRVSQHLRTLPNCPAPLFVDTESHDMSDDEAEKRRALVGHVEFIKDVSFADTRAFVDDLRRYRIGAIVMTPEGIRNRRVKEILRQTGYQKVEMVEKNHIWIQMQSWKQVDERDRHQAEQVCQKVPKGNYVLAPFGVSAHLEEIGCCRSFIHTLPEAFANPSFERRRELLENILSVDKDFLTAEAAVLREVLESRLISAVVLIQHGDGNKRLKDELRRYNFKMATKTDFYRLWIPNEAPAN